MKDQNTSLSWSKLAGILDPVQDTLAPDIWDSDKKMKKNVKKIVVDQIKKVVPLDHIKDLYVLGSITGFKWTSNSDVDIMVLVNPFDPSKEKTKATKKINNRKIPGTNHVINFFLTPWLENSEESMSEADFGVYSIVSDKWIRDPGNYNEIRDPNQEYWAELVVARSVARQFERMAVELENDKKDLEALRRARKSPGDLITYEAIQRKRREVSEGYKDLYEFVADIDKGRKFSYSTGWGIGRESEQNIVFKFLEHGPFGDLFTELKETKDWKTLNER